MRPGTIAFMLVAPLIGLGLITQAVCTWRDTLDRVSNVMLAGAGVGLTAFGCWVWLG